MQAYKYIILPMLLAGMLISLPLIGNTDSNTPKPTYFSKFKDKVVSGCDRMLFSRRMSRVLDRMTSGLIILTVGQFAYLGFKLIKEEYKNQIIRDYENKQKN